MAKIQLHPALRAQIEEHLKNLREFKKMVRSMRIEDHPPEYREETALNAASCGLSIEEMHKRGADNLISQIEKNIADALNLLRSF